LSDFNQKYTVFKEEIQKGKTFQSTCIYVFSISCGINPRITLYYKMCHVFFIWFFHSFICWSLYAPCGPKIGKNKILDSWYMKCRIKVHQRACIGMLFWIIILRNKLMRKIGQSVKKYSFYMCSTLNIYWEFKWQTNIVDIFVSCICYSCNMLCRYSSLLFCSYQILALC
jgi:hypothetical protein